jgi:hypothetical protein
MESHRSSIQEEMGVGVRSSRTVPGDGVVHWLGLLLPGIALALAGDPGPLSIHGHRRSDVMSSQPGVSKGASLAAGGGVTDKLRRLVSNEPRILFRLRYLNEGTLPGWGTNAIG